MATSAFNVQRLTEGSSRTSQNPGAPVASLPTATTTYGPVDWYVGPSSKPRTGKGPSTFDLPTTQGTDDRVTVVPLRQAQLRTLATSGVSSTLLAEWGGCVTAIDDTFFVAELHGLVGNGVVDVVEMAEIPLSDVSPSDKDLLREGAFFRLCISYEKSPTGNLRRYTEVIFRRLPAYTQRELDEAGEEAREFMRGLRLE